MKQVNKLYILVLCLLLSQVSVAAESFSEKETLSVPETLDVMPWFDAETDDYRIYTPDEVRQKIRDAAPQAKPSFDSQSQWVSANFFQWLLYGSVAVLVFVCLFLVFRFLRTETSAVESLSGLKRETAVAHEFFAEDGLSGEKLPVGKSDLIACIERCIQDGEVRSAYIHIFLYAIHIFSEMGLIRTERQYTARDYVRKFAGDRTMTERERKLLELFRVLADNFEVALYSERIPGDADATGCWRRFQILLRENGEM